MSTIQIRHEAPTTAERWSVDAARSSVEFATRTFWGLGTVHGRFDRFTGSYAAGPAGAHIELTIDGSSLDTGNRLRDEHLRSGAFFSVEVHPEVRFSATRVVDTGLGVLDISGDLEVAGRKVPLRLPASITEVGDKLVVEGATTVDPRELGMSSGPLWMIRPPTELRVKAVLVRSEDSAA